MELIFKTYQTPQVSVLKSALMLEGPGGSVSVMAEVYNHSDREIEDLAVSVATKDEQTDIVDQAEVVVGFLPPLEKKLITFRLRQRAEDIPFLELRVKHAGHKDRQA